MKDDYRIYDTHTHIGHARHSGRVVTADELLARMDSFGVDKSVVIPYPVVTDHRAEHDLIGQAVRAHPDRLVGAACLNPFVPEAEFRDEVRRCVEQWGFRALKLQPKFQAINPISPRSDFFFETAVEHDLRLIVHTGDGVPFSLPSLYIVPAQKFPELTIVLGHAGGSVFYTEAIVAALQCANIFIELSTLMPHFVGEILGHVPPSRLMVGSDLPEDLEMEIGKVMAMSLDDEARREILWNTAERVFG
ncbi:MAG: amidohydrolase family protein [Phycisphaeraceae bacterium]